MNESMTEVGIELLGQLKINIMIRANLRPCNVALSVELLYQKEAQQNHKPEGKGGLAH